MAGGTVSRLGASPEEGVKAPVRVETTANITLFGLQTVNGVALQDNDRVMVKDQTDDTENGILIAKVAAAWIRATDFDFADDVFQGVMVISQETSFIYQIIVSGSWTPGVTSVNFGLLFALGGTATWGSIVGTLADQTDLVNALAGKVDNSQVLTNVPVSALFTDTIYTHPNHSGHVESSGDGAMTIQPGVVTPAMQVNILTARIVGRTTAGAGVQEQLSGTTVTALLDEFTNVLKGLVGASGGGTVNFLRADGSWVVPGSAVTSVFSRFGDVTAEQGDYDGFFLTPTEGNAAYLGIAAKAADSELLDGIDSTGFLLVAAKAADSELLDGVDGSDYARTDIAEIFTDDLRINGDIGFYNTAPQVKPTITGSRNSNIALASLLTELAALGLLTDSSS